MHEWVCQLHEVILLLRNWGMLLHITMWKIYLTHLIVLNIPQSSWSNFNSHHQWFHASVTPDDIRLKHFCQQYGCESMPYYGFNFMSLINNENIFTCFWPSIPMNFILLFVSASINKSWSHPKMCLNYFTMELCE